MTPDYALEFRGVRKSCKGFTLKDVSFTLPSGIIGGLIGPNLLGRDVVLDAAVQWIRRESAKGPRP